MFNSKNFYKQIAEAQNFINDKVAEAGGSKVRLYIHSGFGYSEETNMASLTIDSEYDDPCKVKGRDLGEMVEEYIRRKGFNKRQEQLQLAGPVIEQEKKE